MDPSESLFSQKFIWCVDYSSLPAWSLEPACCRVVLCSVDLLDIINNYDKIFVNNFVLYFCQYQIQYFLHLMAAYIFNTEWGQCHSSCPLPQLLLPTLPQQWAVWCGGWGFFWRGQCFCFIWAGQKVDSSSTSSRLVLPWCYCYIALFA